MNKKFLYKTNYDKLETVEKQKILADIALHYGFSIKQYVEFEKKDTSLYTAVFDDNGTEFVFIPGAKNIFLGWKTSVSGKKEDPALVKKIQNIFLDYFFMSKVDYKLIDADDIKQLQLLIDGENYKQADSLLSKMVYKFIDKHTSFFRRIDVEPMLMERKSNSVNWVFVKEISSKAVADSPSYLKIYQEIVKSDSKFIIKKHKTKTGTKIQKFEIADHGLNVYKHVHMTYEEILFSYASKGYNIPNINQWEYAATAGAKYFFQCDMLSNRHKYSPNAFGLYIADNIYKPEILSDNKHIYKAGDNGYFKNYISEKLASFSLNPFYNVNSDLLEYNNDNGFFARKVITVDLDKRFRPSINKKNINSYITENLLVNNIDNIIYAADFIKSSKISFKNVLKIIKIYNEKDFINEAYELVEKYMDMGQNSPEFLYMAGLTAFKKEDYKTSEALLKRAIFLRRNMPECYQLLAFIYHILNNTEEMEKALHNLHALAEDVAQSMIQIIMLKSSFSNVIDYDELWHQLVNTFTKESAGKINIYTNTSEVVLLDSTVQMIIRQGMENYIKYIKPTGSIYLMEILKKIEASPYLKDETYLSESDYEQAVDEFNACKNIIYEAENITDLKVNKEYLQDLTNAFFDNFPALLAFAYIYYSNCRLFEAGRLFDENYTLCASLYRAKELPVKIADEIRVLLEDFINMITMNILTYGQIQEHLDKIMEDVKAVKERFFSKTAQRLLAVDLSITKDIKYILNWFNIEIDIKDAMRKNN